MIHGFFSCCKSGEGVYQKMYVAHAGRGGGFFFLDVNDTKSQKIKQNAIVFASPTITQSRLISFFCLSLPTMKMSTTFRVCGVKSPFLGRLNQGLPRCILPAQD